MHHIIEYEFIVQQNNILQLHSYVVRSYVYLHGVNLLVF